jgi:hypothetical protein
MARWTIRRMMIVIAGVALGLGGLVGLSRMPGGCEIRCYRQCDSNIRNVEMAILQYANFKGQFPTGTWPNPDLPPERRLSWYAAITPFAEAQDLYQQVNWVQSWDAPPNDVLAHTVIGVFRCPQGATTPLGDPFPASYIGIAGVGTDAPFLATNHPRAGVFGYDRRVTLADLKDGAATTLLVAESERVRDSWLAGGPATVRGLDTVDLPYIGPGRQFGAAHTRPGAYVAFADGAVRFIPDTINPKVFEAMSTIAGGEKVPQDAFEP